ncbi:N-carbamoylputrescine amidase [Novosphingobium nitrogenifigens DSM 19370]|uniref:N-carbamoylputrescine amidase n=1 Tax=Novosphingobium nitrogenifigens DSM 19370 TaxID=983920 RepID=F1ZB74_9SPHN|nr:N-carbamoylputrescine amidase [Novosphingobium nitrogenifigens]EGD58059.1 N-carbamoylputrescine amidase [Novosphingobium nitrogenifigens DSM 19370]
MRTVTVAATQFACTWDLAANLDTAEALVREAAGNGAQVVLLQELFETPYFCPDERAKHFALARPREGHPVLARFSALARELGVVLPFSFFEKVGSTHFNSLVMLDADGRDLGLYRKSHIPQGPGYREKFFFAPGDTGFQVWDTAFGRIGAAICWDQWFPECARSLALKGAELILYPTAIGTEPLDPGFDSQPHWQRTMQGHAAANMVPVIASNRIGHEVNEDADITFYGSSFITDQFGALVAQAGRDTREAIVATFDLDEIAPQRAGWGLFRDRRPELYGTLTTYGG